MSFVNLLSDYPRTKRNLVSRNFGTEADKILARQFGREYFDGERYQGYGGYKYDGRWRSIARRICDHWNLKPGDKILDVGCAKGFLMKDLMIECPGLECFGIDVSDYALNCAEKEACGRIGRANALHLPFKDNSFTAVVSINTIHNLEVDGVKQCIKELSRVASKQYLQIDAYRTKEELEIFLRWVITAKTFMKPDEWEALFQEVNYKGDYAWTILEVEDVEKS